MDQGLVDALGCGVAYHHAALTGEEKSLLEIGFREGTIFALCATTTLATGVNLPARRVIFRAPRVAIDPLDITRYRQAAGRAGRTGLDSKGESFIIGKPAERTLMKSLLSSALPPVSSNFGLDKRGMMRVLLEGIVAKRLYIITHPTHRDKFEARVAAVRR